MDLDTKDMAAEAEVSFDNHFDNLKTMVLSRAWCKKDYDDMNARIENIRTSIKKNCHLPLLARQPALTDDLFFRLLESPDNEDAFMGLNLFDMLTMEID